MSDPVSPIFIFSLPRSGSTLLQRILAAHPDIATVSEPWLILPFVYATRSNGVAAEYSHETLARAINDVCDKLPHGRTDYYRALRELILGLYSELAGGGSRYFLDKTPRYHLIIPEIMEIFPGAKCLLLFRNPLAVAASLIETWGRNGRWNLFRFRIDLYRGLENLVAAATEFKGRLLQLSYERMVSDPDETLPPVFEFLDIPFQTSAPVQLEPAGDFSTGLGDPTGTEKYDGVSTDSVHRWRRVLDNPLRRAWARRYLDWIGAERLRLMGYDMSDLLTQLESMKGFDIRCTLSDGLRMPLGALGTNLGLREVKRQARAWLTRQRSYLAN